MSKATPQNLSRRLYRPRPIDICSDADGVPLAVGSVAVESLVEEWLVEDRWWTERPLRRHYFELLLVNGHNTVVFHDLINQRWFSQRGA